MKKAYYLIVATFCAEASLKAMLPSRSFQGMRTMRPTAIQRQTLSPVLINKNRLFSTGQPSQVPPKSWKAWFSQLFTPTKTTAQKNVNNQQELRDTLKIQNEEIQGILESIVHIEKRNQPRDTPAIQYFKELLKIKKENAQETERELYKMSEIIKKQELQQKNVDREAHE